MVKLPPDENGFERSVSWESHERVLAERRAADEERARQQPPRWVRRLSLPDVQGRREEYWVNANIPAPPVWWEPKALGRLPLPRRH